MGFPVFSCVTHEIWKQRVLEGYYDHNQVWDSIIELWKQQMISMIRSLETKVLELAIVKRRDDLEADREGWKRLYKNFG